MSEDTKFALCCWAFDICMLVMYAVGGAMLIEVIAAL
jgi:hypothetical protein